MTPAEAAAVLSKCAAFDNRTPTESAARAWAESIDSSVTVTDALAIVSVHYARESRWIMPADINASSSAMRKARLDVIRMPDPPSTLDPDDVHGWQVWSRAYRTAIGDGHDEDRADRLACQAAGVTRPAEEITARPVDAVVKQIASRCR